MDGDGVVTSADITQLYNFLLSGDSSGIVNGDVDGDETITSGDITAIYSILLGVDQASLPAATGSSCNVKVGPVPSSDYIVASADGYIQGVELYDMSGNLVVRHGGNFVNVENITSGDYTLKVYTSSEVTTHHVTVKH